MAMGAFAAAGNTLGAWMKNNATEEVELRGSLEDVIRSISTGETEFYQMRGVNLDTGEAWSDVTFSRQVCVYFVQLAMDRWELRIGGLVASCRDGRGRLILGIDTVDGRPVASFGDGKVKSFTRVQL